MDDLLGEDWQAPSKPTTKPFLTPSYSSSILPTLQPSRSGAASPQIQISRPSSTANGGASKASNNDAFGSILAVKPRNGNGNVSIQERQRVLEAEKRRLAERQADLWEGLGSGRATPEVRANSPAPATTLRKVVQEEDEEDILKAFGKDVVVDKASYYPPPSSGRVSRAGTPALVKGGGLQDGGIGSGAFDDDDDPFGLGAAPKLGNGHSAKASARHQVEDDDDILGNLGKPVAVKPPQRVPTKTTAKVVEDVDYMDSAAARQDSKDQSLAELVEMGFPVETAKIALGENGGNVQGAVGWLLQQAHEESKQKARAMTEAAQPSRRRSPVTGGGRSPPRIQRGEQDSVPAWMRQDTRSSSGTRRQDSRSPANGAEKDAAAVAQELGSKLFKGANSLWKASQKQMAKTMTEFQADGRETGQPRWMQEVGGDSSRASSQKRTEERSVPKVAARKAVVDVTDEAAMLDAPRESYSQPPPKSGTLARPTVAMESPARGRSPVETLPIRPSSQSAFTQQRRPPPQEEKKPATKLSRKEVEDEAAQGYVSSSRRRRPNPPKPEPQPVAQEEVDLFSSAPAVKHVQPPSQPEVDLFSSPLPTKPAPGPPRSATAPVIARGAQGRPPPPSVNVQLVSRPIPPTSAAALATSNRHRNLGGEAFKRGDYASAHECYTSALTPLPPTHPVVITLLCNRALTALKTGDAKAAVTDAERALTIIGAGKGANEIIDLGGGEVGKKAMGEFYGKALMRKAEALEHLEKWAEAAAVWRLAVEAGVGGAVSVRGRERCEKAAAPPTTANAPPVRSAAVPKTGPVAKAQGRVVKRPLAASASASSAAAEAVTALRAANAAAERQDDEKFALMDQVDARLTSWKGGKADNLRALLQSLDAVLWEGAGWKKVGMADLVVVGKVRGVYQRAIGKVHPDKIRQDATTEQRMISAAVFSTLNEAWDKFKRDNNL